MVIKTKKINLKLKMAALDAEYYRIMTAKQMSNIEFNEKQNEAYSMMVNRKMPFG